MFRQCFCSFPCKVCFYFELFVLRIRRGAVEKQSAEQILLIWFVKHLLYVVVNSVKQIGDKIMTLFEEAKEQLWLYLTVYGLFPYLGGEIFLHSPHFSFVLGWICRQRKEERVGGFNCI